MIADILLASIGVGVVALMTTIALSPIETLSWWAGWTEEEVDEEEPVAAPENPCDDAAQFIVYLSGVAAISGDHLLKREKKFLDRLRERMPGAVIIDDVFPYAPSGRPMLNGARAFERLWRRLQNFDLQGRQTFLRSLINLRNIYQVMVCADHRYGPIFSQGAASAIQEALLSAGYRPECGTHIVIIGYSGGAQVAIGAAPFLKSHLGAPVDVISIGGVVSSDPGLSAVDSLHHFYGEKDAIEQAGVTLFPQRWALFANSHWNDAKRQGRINLHPMENIFHAGPRGYFGLPKRGDQSNNERTADAIADVLRSLVP